MVSGVKNKEVIEMLEECIAKAKAEQWGYALVLMLGDPNLACCSMAGTAGLEGSAKVALQTVMKRLDQCIDSWTPPAPDPSLDASHACLNIANFGLCFDFIDWLVTAEMDRIAEGAPAPLKVGFWHGTERDDIVNMRDRQRWLEYVFRPALAFVGAIEAEIAVYGRQKTFLGRGEVAHRCREGEKVPKFRARAPMDKFAGYVTLTLRELEGHSWRNNNVPEWILFGKYLQSRGEKVVFVRDTAHAFKPVPGFETCPEASAHISARMALYDAAKCNYFGANGTHSLAVYGSKPWVQFNMLDPSGQEYGQTKQGWENGNGVCVGGQYPWSSADQRIFWDPDTLENLKASWESRPL
jgi:hypothetical protein